MSDAPRTPAVDALRAEFDATFAAAPRAAPPAAVALLMLRVGGEPVALRVLETAGLLQARPVIPVPSGRPELLGLCGVRGSVLLVYELARLLGRAEEGGALRWLILAGAGERRVALAVAALEAHLLVPAADLRRTAPGPAARAHVAEVVRRGESMVPVVSVPSVLRALTGAEGG